MFYEQRGENFWCCNSSTGAALKGVDEKTIDAQIALLKKQLSLPEISAMNQEFEKLKSGLRDSEWYVPGGVANFREMAKAVSRESESEKCSLIKTE